MRRYDRDNYWLFYEAMPEIPRYRGHTYSVMIYKELRNRNLLKALTGDINIERSCEGFDCNPYSGGCADCLASNGVNTELSESEFVNISAACIMLNSMSRMVLRGSDE